MIMTFTRGYALTSSDSLEELDMGGGSTVELDDQVGDDRGALTWAGCCGFPGECPMPWRT